MLHKDYFLRLPMSAVLAFILRSFSSCEVSVCECCVLVRVLLPSVVHVFAVFLLLIHRITSIRNVWNYVICVRFLSLLYVNPLKGRDVSWLHFAIQI